MFRLGSNAQDKYAEKKFAPHSEEQIAEFSNIYVRPYALRDALVDIQKKTNMNFYLSGRWY